MRRGSVLSHAATWEAPGLHGYDRFSGRRRRVVATELPAHGSPGGIQDTGDAGGRGFWKQLPLAVTDFQRSLWSLWGEPGRMLAALLRSGREPALSASAHTCTHRARSPPHLDAPRVGREVRGAGGPPGDAELPLDSPFYARLWYSRLTSRLSCWLTTSARRL